PPRRSTSSTRLRRSISDSTFIPERLTFAIGALRKKKRVSLLCSSSTCNPLNSPVPFQEVQREFKTFLVETTMRERWHRCVHSLRWFASLCRGYSRQPLALWGETRC